MKTLRHRIRRIQSDKTMTNKCGARRVSPKGVTNSCSVCWSLLIAINRRHRSTAVRRHPTNTKPLRRQTPKNVTLTPAQRQRIHVYTVTSANYHRRSRPPASSISTTTRRPACSRPFPVRYRVCWLSLGDKVNKGQALAEVDSPDFTAAVGAYRKALVRRTHRASACRSGCRSAQASRRIPTRGRTGRNRRGQRRSRSRRRADRRSWR